MLTIGAPLRKWTLLLLFSCISTSAANRPANETVVVSTASGSTTVQHTPSASSSSILSSHKYADNEIVCLFRTINYITHTLPQQCAKTSWSAPAHNTTANETTIEVEATPSEPVSTSRAKEGAGSSAEQGSRSAASPVLPLSEETAFAETALGAAATSADSEVELETDSPFDNANFLSFEEWKKKNLAQVGQSPENVGQGRAAPSNQPARRRPVNVNALDSLGDEGEIEIDFSGFGTPAEDASVASKIPQASLGEGITKATEEEGKVAPSSWALSKDAGKTCKERFNYASFDCAATVLKANKQAKSSSSILVENKDSYMLNECSADNKFLIIELCDDILVDTIVLANYEFFSSMFRHFRVSVSDRYPVKIERWRILGTFEARNSRDIQPFLITEPQIWARYLRIEFLSQFGNEFYCPLSLLRVHGTTMMEQFRREEEEARGMDDDDEELHEATQTDLVKPAEDSGPILPDQAPIQPIKDDITHSTEAAAIESAMSSEAVTASNDDNNQAEPLISRTTAATPPNKSTDAPKSGDYAKTSSTSSPADISSILKDDLANPTTTGSSKSSDVPLATNKAEPSSQSQSKILDASVVTQSSIATRNDNVVNLAPNAATSASSSSPPAKASSDGTVVNSQAQSQSRNSPTQPNPATPSTQESFFKSIHKRLLYLEANSTLSLQYIEEQSRILRDAFVKVEKRQLAKTEKFLDHLNSTVMHELKNYRNMYDQLWQSTIIELEGMKERQKAEMGEIGTRLSLMADELVWQKRMAVVQSALLLLCLGLVLFVRSGTLSSAADVPIVQQLGSRYSSFFETSPPQSPEASGIARRRRTFRNMWRSDTSVGLSDPQSDGQQALSDAEEDGARSPDVQIECSPPTPDSPSAPTARNTLANTQVDGIGEVNEVTTPDSIEDQAKRVQVLETQSGPATPNGTRDSRPSWEEVDRAMDQLKAETKGDHVPLRTKKDRDRKKKKKRSPLRRAHSSYDGAADDSPPDHSANELFVD